MRILERRKRIIRLLAIALAIGVIFVSLNRFAKTQKPAVPPSRPSLQNALQTALRGAKGTYGIAIKNFKTKESYSQNGDRIFEAGSLYKLWVMAPAFNKLQTGQWQEDEVLTENIATLNARFSIDPDSAEQTAGVITLTVSEALKQMITISHNYAALLLTDKLKLSSVKTFLQDNGLNGSTVGEDNSSPSITPDNLALFLEKLYGGQLANQEYTDKMLNLLKLQQLNDKLPKYLPAGTVVAHKTGEIGWFTHDGGIVYSQGGDYIIVVLSETDFPPGAEERIAQISKAVFEYFNEKND